MPFTVTMQVLDPEICYALLRELEPKVAKKVIKKSIRAGAKAFVRAAKSEAPVDSGMLKRSITTRVRTYKSKILAVIGPRRFKYPNGRNPANYAHLVEQGHRVSRRGKLTRAAQAIAVTRVEPASIAKLRGKIGGGKNGPGVQIGFAKANPFMHRAASTAKQTAIEDFRASAELGILAEASLSA